MALLQARRGRGGHDLEGRPQTALHPAALLAARGRPVPQARACFRLLLLYPPLPGAPGMQETVQDHEGKVKIYASVLFLIRQLFKPFFSNKQKLG